MPLQPLYHLLAWAAQPLLRRKLARRGVAEPGYLHAVDERFGRYSQPRPAGSAPLIWVHAVSLGETRAAAALIAELRQHMPGMRLLLTHGTATGRAEGQKLLQSGDVQVWQPWDSRAAVRRFLHHFRPDLGLLMETEVWPNLVRQSARAGVPLLLVNARLSEKSLRRARQAGLLMRPAYAALRAAWAQTDADARRLREMGVPLVRTLGNLKYDLAPSPGLAALGQGWRAQAGGRPVVMLASSREGEERLLLEQIRALPAPARSAVQWLIVARHPQRFDEIARLIEAQGWPVRRRSQRADWIAPPPGDIPADMPADQPYIALGDSLGEMPAYYHLAHLALLGGSFAPLGGQNLIEAAACACPVFMGPHTFNFAQAAQSALQTGAARRFDDLAQALPAAIELCQTPAAHARMAQAALAFAQSHRGSARRQAQASLEFLMKK
ncbi:MAG: 3-deoxy-D-manno-octulosonic acid transferase [Ottowia sp.]